MRGHCKLVGTTGSTSADYFRHIGQNGCLQLNDVETPDAVMHANYPSADQIMTSDVIQYKASIDIMSIIPQRTREYKHVFY